MSYVKTRGIVLREAPFGEADKYVTLFTRNLGKVSVYARGARRPKSSLVAGTQYMCYSEYVLFKGRDSYTINSCELVEPFYEIRNDLIKLTYSAHIADITNDIIQENQPASKVLQLLLNTLHALAKTEKQPELLSRVFEMRVLSIIGYSPYVKGCTECGCEEYEKVSFSFKKCGLLCGNPNCRAADASAVAIASGTVRALQHIVHSPVKDIFSFTVSPEVLNDLGRINRRYLRERLERDYTKLDFLKTLA